MLVFLFFLVLTNSPERLEGLKFTRQLFHKFIDTLEIKCNWKPEQIFLFGFSSGGSCALDIGLTYSKRLGGVVSISGSLLNEQLNLKNNWISTSAQNTPFLITHGTLDEVEEIGVAKSKVNLFISFFFLKKSKHFKLIKN